MKAPPQSLKQAHYYDEMDHVFDITSKIARDNAIREEMKKMEDELRAMQEQQQAKKPSAMSSANKSDILLEQVNVLKQFLPEEMADFETLDLDTQLAKLAELKSKAGSMELIFKITDLESHSRAKKGSTILKKTKTVTYKVLNVFVNICKRFSFNKSR